MVHVKWTLFYLQNLDSGELQGGTFCLKYELEDDRGGILGKGAVLPNTER